MPISYIPDTVRFSPYHVPWRYRCPYCGSVSVQRQKNGKWKCKGRCRQTFDQPIDALEA